MQKSDIITFYWQGLQNGNIYPPSLQSQEQDMCPRTPTVAIFPF